MDNDIIADLIDSPAELDKDVQIDGTDTAPASDIAEPVEAPVEVAGTEAPVDAPVIADKEITDIGGKSYDALRIKMNDQGVELNELRAKHKTVEEQMGMGAEELTAYKKWYDQYYPVLNDLWQDEALRGRIEGNSKPHTITEADAEKIADRKLTEFKEQSKFERSVDGWIEKHPDVKGDLAENIYKFLEKHDLSPTPDLLETAYVFCTKDRVKALGVKEKELQDKKIADAAVGGGGPSIPGRAGNPIDDLFTTPASDYYPGAKI